uniref:Uncharacterized protein n=1 Tax=Nelumbo nucifera TaxID=4432 RepID=A0A822YJE9_NELNU|nr:TPA_asm: hypothetical protein HUJ06_010290 [Nelumbo nucifera]
MMQSNNQENSHTSQGSEGIMQAAVSSFNIASCCDDLTIMPKFVLLISCEGRVDSWVDFHLYNSTNALFYFTYASI